MINTLPKEYTIDKNYIYKNTFEELKELLKENEKIKLITYPKYVPIAFEVMKELNEEGLSTYDEELKIERNFKDKKSKTTIYFSIKRKNDLFLIGNNYFTRNIFEEVKNCLKHQEKITLVCKNNEVGLAFKVAKELVEQGIAIYDEELKLGRNFKNGQGKTKVFISLKRKPKIKEYFIKQNSDISENIKDMKELLEKNEKVNITALPKDVGNAFKIANCLVNEGFATYDEELKIKRNFKKEKEKTKICISLKKNTKSKNINNINSKTNIKYINENQNIKKDKHLCEKDNKINSREKKIELELNNIGDDEKNLNVNKEKTFNIISTNKQKEEIKEYKINKNFSHEKIVKDIKELLRENKKVILDTPIDKVWNVFTAIKVLNNEGIAILDEELKIERNFKEKFKTKILISIKRKEKIIN